MLERGIIMELGKTEKKHNHCTYTGREKDCPKDCAKCAFTFKSEGDQKLKAGLIDEAIKLFKKALFADPKFAEAWLNLAQAYSVREEYHNAIAALNKALAIDSKYGQAMFSKAIILANLGDNEAAMALTNSILELYDDTRVKEFKKRLLSLGVKDNTGIYSLQKAIDKMTEKGYEIITQNRLADKDGRITTIQAICRKEDFAQKTYSFCRKRYNSLGDEKVWSESIISSFYGSAIVALCYYKNPKAFLNVDPFDYLSNNANLEELDRNAEAQLGIRGNNTESDKVWNIIYSFVQFCTPILSGIEPKNHLDNAIIDATESAYIIGMLLAMRHHERVALKEKRQTLDDQLKKLIDSTGEYHYSPPERSAMCYSIREPAQIPFYFKCDACGQNASMTVFDSDGEEKQMIEKYKSLANEFTKLGYPSRIKCYCDECAERFFPSSVSYSKNNIVFSLSRPDRKTPIYSFPSTWGYYDVEYQTALAFLRGSDTIAKLSEATKTKLPASDYLKRIKTVLGGIEGAITIDKNGLIK